ncbi:MAG: hypothetical protein JXQ87_17900 [Bacteroidia bacterium]
MKKTILAMMTVGLISLSSCNSKNPESHKPLSVKMEMDKNDDPFTVFISTNYHFYTKYYDPNYKSYKDDHWQTIDSNKIDGRLNIIQRSNCAEDSFESEHYTYYRDCLKKIHRTIDIDKKLTTTLRIWTENNINRIEYTYDENDRLINVLDSTENEKYQFIYEDAVLEEIQVFHNTEKSNMKTKINFVEK